MYIYNCSSLQDVYICIDSYLDGCAPGLKLAYYTAITAARYLCNEGRQGIIVHFNEILTIEIIQCIYMYIYNTCNDLCAYLLDLKE